MNMMRKIGLGILLCMLVSCNMGDLYYVDFENIETTPDMFRVVRQQYTDMEELIANGGIKTIHGVYRRHVLIWLEYEKLNISDEYDEKNRIRYIIMHVGIL